MKVIRAQNGKHARVQVRTVALTVLGALAVALVCRAFFNRQAAPVPPEAASAPPAKVIAPSGPVTGTPSAGAATGVLMIQPDQVLATVNGHQITGQDAIPLTGTNQPTEISSNTLNFYLHRAVDRELIFEAAQKKGIVLDDSQNHQIANMQAMRDQREPGEIAKLNNDPGGRRLETLDAEAFSLQTAIMAAQGSSPNVTDSQVQDYFQQHQSDFANLPADPNARDQAWQKVAFQIRSQLAASTRAKYNSDLAAYMQKMESEAEVVFDTPQQ